MENLLFRELSKARWGHQSLFGGIPGSDLRTLMCYAIDRRKLNG